MPNRHAAYPAAFREQILELVRAGRTPEELTGSSNPRHKPSATGWRRPSAIVGNEPMV